LLDIGGMDYNLANIKPVHIPGKLVSRYNNVLSGLELLTPLKNLTLKSKFL
jgi:hypothetical protein